MQPLRITLIQTNLVWEDPAANRALLEEKIRALPDSGQIIFLPEMFTTGFTMQPELLAEPMDGPSLQWMQRLAAEKKCILCGSLAIRESAEANSSTPHRYFNRLFWVLPNGHFGQYDKRHLFAYAGEDRHYTAGSGRLIASVNGWKINLQICYDLRFPVWARQAPAPEQRDSGESEYDALVYLANWPTSRSYAWRSLLIARAIENQSYVIGVNRIGIDGNGIEHSGNSMLVDPTGDVLFEQAGGEAVHTTDLSGERLLEIRRRFPFIKDGDTFGLFL
jgi:predicted amidohydrolase